MKKHTRIALSLILVMCMLLSGVPIASPIVAIATDNLTSEATTETLPSETVSVGETVINDDVSIVEEDVSLRGEYEKHFLMSDGSYQVALYNEPVHKREDGEWIEIDNTLAIQTAADGTTQYATVDGLADVGFSQTYGDQLVTMQQGDYSVSWGVEAVSGNTSIMASGSATLSAELEQPIVVEPIEAELIAADLSTYSSEEQKTLAVKSSSAIQYSDALGQDVDLEYIVLPSRIKENIILQSAQDISYYVVTVYTENLSARLLENREIEFYNDCDEVIFTMTSPYMYDSAGELSEDIAVEMVAKGDGCYFIKMTPNAQWLGDESRVYPVVIDPQVSVDTTRTNIIDNYVLEGGGVQNRNLDRLYIGNRSEGLTRAFIKYDTMPTLPEGATITAATMTLTLTNGTNTASNAIAYQVGSDWESGTIAWANMPSLGTPQAFNISHNNMTQYRFSCLEAVKEWYTDSTTGQNQNYGIMLRYYDETVDDYNAVYSADYTDESKRPLLSITYTPFYVNVTVPKTYIFVGHTLQATCLTAPGELSVTWYSSNTAVATINSSGLITAKSEGTAKITASYYHATSGVTYSDYVYVNVYASYGLKTGKQYHIMNYETKRLLSLESFTDVDSTNVCTRVRSNLYSSRWTLEEQNDGRFQLINGNSSTGKVLHVSGSNVDIYTDNNTESEKFIIYRLNSGIYAGLYYFRYGSYFVAQDDNNNVYLTSSPSNKAIWSFSLVAAGYANIYSHDYYYTDEDDLLRHFETDTNNTYFTSTFGTNLGYTSSAEINVMSNNAYDALCRNNQQIFAFMGHGGPGRIAFNGEDAVSNGRIMADPGMWTLTNHYYISDCSDNQLNSLRCVLYLGCSTGVDYVTNDNVTYNLVDSTYEKGAHFVLGTTETLYTGQINDWMKYFLDYVNAGCSVGEACTKANLDLGTILVPTGEVDAAGENIHKEADGLPTYKVGDEIQYLNLP